MRLPRALRAAQVRRPVGGTGDQTVTAAQRARPAPGAQMNAGPSAAASLASPGHHQGKAARATDPREVAPERRPSRLAVMAQHDAGEAARQARHRTAGDRAAAARR